MGAVPICLKQGAIKLPLGIISDINGIDEQEVFWIIFKGGKKKGQ